MILIGQYKISAPDRPISHLSHNRPKGSHCALQHMDDITRSIRDFSSA